MEAKFLKNIGAGCYICVTFGEKGNVMQEEGIVLSLEDDVMQLETADGEVYLCIEDIRMCKQLKSKTLPSNPAPVVQAGKPVQENAMKQESLLEDLDWSSLLRHETFSMNSSDEIDSLKTMIRGIQNKEIRQLYLNSLDAISHAVKNNSLKEKCHNLKAKLLSTTQDCNRDEHQVLDMLLGFLFLSVAEYELATDAYARAKNYRLAAYAAQNIPDQEKASSYKLFALFSQEPGVMPTQEIADICIARQDVTPLLCYLKTGKLSSELEKATLGCAAYILASNGFCVKKVPVYTMAKQAEEFLLTLPEAWRANDACYKLWEKAQMFVYRLYEVPADLSREQIGVIKYYNHPTQCGSISCQDKKWHFHVCQVPQQEVLLRTLLAQKKADGVQVVFSAGYNRNGIAANNVRLTPLGTEQAQKTLKKEKRVACISRFEADKNWGVLEDIETLAQYQFKTANMADPYLRAYYENDLYREDFLMQVEVEPQANGTLRALNIVRKDAFSPEEDQMLKQYITPQGEQHWTNWLLQDEKPLAATEYEGYAFRLLPTTNPNEDAPTEHFTQHLQPPYVDTSLQLWRSENKVSEELLSQARKCVSQCEAILDGIFEREFPKIASYTCDEVLKDTRSFQALLSNTYPKFTLDVFQCLKCCETARHMNKSPKILSGMSFGYKAEALSLLWEQFAWYFSDENVVLEKLGFVAKTRNLLAHQASLLTEEELVQCVEYVDAISRVVR